MFTLVHVTISLLGIITGLVAVGGFMAGARRDGVTGAFLVTTVLTNATGFGFASEKLLPSHIVAVISLVLLAVCLVARYVKGLAGHWRRVFVITAVAALYFNVFVLVVQLFQKTPALAALAPTQSEPPFAVTQVLMLGIFLWLGRAAVRGFGPAR
jgi:magnesium-transporting ATPase (P-type)